MEAIACIEKVCVKEHILEIVSDSGEGAQKAGQIFGAVSAKMKNGIWTVEIIPAEIQPPPRTIHGASGNRIRLGAFSVTNAGNEADVVLAFNEQVLLSRVLSHNLKKSAVILLENCWRSNPDPDIVKAYLQVHKKLVDDGYKVHEIPIEMQTRKYIKNPRRGKNMFALGVLAFLYTRDMEKMRSQIAFAFRHKGQEVIDINSKLLDAGYVWAQENMNWQFEIPAYDVDKPQVVMNGNTSIALGAMACGMEICAMYPITPATSASHYLSEVFKNVGGVVHQAEDEIAACAFAIGASYAGKCALTITSGPGLALKTELLGLAAMAEIPLVLIDVQRGGPSTGLPTKIEQSDLLAAIFATPGDAPKIVIAPATIEDCFYTVITARKLAETFRVPVLILSDANLATGQQPFARPDLKDEWFAPPIDQSPIELNKKPYDWDENTGLSQRFIPGQAGGMHTLTGLAHDEKSCVAYCHKVHQRSSRFRSLKLATLQKTLKTPEVFGEAQGDLLIIGWGSTKGAIEEAVLQAQKEDLRVSSIHLKFLNPLPLGIKKIMQRFKKVITVEINYSDVEDMHFNKENKRYSQLAWLLRGLYLIDVDCYSKVCARPLKPLEIKEMIEDKIKEI